MKFSELADYYERIGRAKNNGERIRLLVEAFDGADDPTLAAIAHFSIGELVRPEFSDRLGIGPATIREQIAKIADKDPSEIDEEVREAGDMSLVAAAHTNGKDRLRVDELWKLVDDAVHGEDGRSKLVARVFTNTTLSGVKYLTRMALDQMRINVGLGTLMQALGKAFKVSVGSVEHFYTMTNDIGLTAVSAKRARPRSNTPGPCSSTHTNL